MTTTFGSLTVPSHNGFRVIMGIGSAASLAALLLAAFLPGRRAPVDAGVPAAANEAAGARS
jgi:hypothetical protein